MRRNPNEVDEEGDKDVYDVQKAVESAQPIKNKDENVLSKSRLIDGKEYSEAALKTLFTKHSNKQFTFKKTKKAVDSSVTDIHEQIKKYLDANPRDIKYFVDENDSMNFLENYFSNLLQPRQSPITTRRTLRPSRQTEDSRSIKSESSRYSRPETEKALEQGLEGLQKIYGPKTRNESAFIEGLGGIKNYQRYKNEFPEDYRQNKERILAGTFPKEGYEKLKQLLKEPSRAWPSRAGPSRAGPSRERSTVSMSELKPILSQTKK